MAIGFQGYRSMQQMQPMGIGGMRRGGIGGLRGNLRQGFNPMQMGMQAPQGMMPPQQFAMPQGRGAMRQGFNPMQMGMMAPAAMTLASPMQPRPQQMAGMDAANVAIPSMTPAAKQAQIAQFMANSQVNPVTGQREMTGAGSPSGLGIGGMGMPLQQMMPQEQAFQARRLAPQQFGPMGGPGFAQPLSPPPSQQQQMLGGPQQQGGQAMGGAKWTMEIKPSEGMYAGGIITLAGGGQIPAYGLGGFLKKLGKAAAKLAPVAVGFIPGVSALSAPLQGLIGAGAKAASDLASADFDFGALDAGSILESGMGAAFMAKAQQDPEWAAANRNKIAALEALSGGQAGGQGTDPTANRMMPEQAMASGPGASSARGGASDPGTIAQIEEAASSQYNLFDQLGGRAGGGPVGSLYAMKRFGGGEVDGYRIGGLRGRKRRGRRGRRGGRESSRPRRSPRRSVRPPTRAPVQRAQPVAPPPPPVSSAPDMMPAIPDVMPVAPLPPPARPAPVRAPAPPPAMAPPVMDTPVAAPPPPPAPVRPPPVRAPAPPPPMAPAIEDMIPETVSASPVRAPERPKAPPVNRPMAAFPDAIGIEDDGPPMMPQPAAPRAPRKMSPERERPVDIPVVGGFIPSEGEPAPFAPEIEEILPATTGRGEERRRSRRGREGGEGRGLMGSEGGGERREERRSRDSGRRGEEGGELGGEKTETTSGAEDMGRGSSKEEGRYKYGDRMTEEQKRMAEKFATKDPESPLTLGTDESANIENIRAIAQGKPADDIASIEGTMIEPENVNDPTPPSIVGYQNPQLLAQRDAELMATPVTYQRPPPPPPPALAQASETPIIDAPSGDRAMGQSALGLGDIFGAGASPFNMPTEAAQFEDPRMRAMLERMDAPEAPLETYVPEPEAQDKAEGGMIEAMQQMPEVMQLLQMALQAPDAPESQEIMSTLAESIGEKELQQLIASLQAEPAGPMAPPMQSGGKIPGNGDAMADDIRLIADKGTPEAQPIDISSGEFVVAGDVVSHLGSGNTDRGAAVLDQFQKDVRINRTGTGQQPPPIDLQEVLPGTYGDRYA